MEKLLAGFTVVGRAFIFNELALCADSDGGCYLASGNPRKLGAHISLISAFGILKFATGHSPRFRFQAMQHRGYRSAEDSQLYEIMPLVLVNDIKYIVNSFEPARAKRRRVNAGNKS